MNKERVVHIENGPDRFAIIVALFEGNQRQQRTVEFHMIEGNPLVDVNKWIEYIKLNSAERESGSGDTWNLTGYNVVNSCKVKIFYDIRYRKGTMTFLKK